ncbi:MAG TPA: outer membrane beta-barrel protein [Terriglobales bacterium]|jgi:outer membrane immunogenic protein|nr:outer membrane beta-barrel protein [Terriglobales bacterium]
MFKTAAIAIASFFLLTVFGFAQENRQDISVNVTGDFGTTSQGNNVIQTPSNSLGLLGTYRFKLNALSSLEVNFGITRNTQYYASRSVITAGQTFFAIQSNVSEATADYVFTPWKSGRLRPFLFAGAGTLIFNPTGNSFGTTASETEIKGAISYGGGADYRLLKNVALRLQYRGLVYKAPDFYVTGLTTGTVGNLEEPSLGLVFRF